MDVETRRHARPAKAAKISLYRQSPARVEQTAEALPTGTTEEIRDNLPARIGEALREGWLGEVEGLHVSLACAHDKLARIDAALQRWVLGLRLE
jgi:hypothetical protein